MAEAGDQAIGLAAETADGESQFPAEFVEVVAAAVRKLTALQQVPEAFGGIEVGRIGGQAFQMQPLRCARHEEVFDRLAAVDRRAIPNHQQLATHLPQQLTQERDHRRPTKGRLLEMREAPSV